MAWINVIDENEADGALKTTYEKVVDHRGKISNIMRIHSQNPRTMVTHLDLYMSIMFGQSGLKREEREMIGVLVSRLNNCTYCVFHHMEALESYWKDEKAVHQIANNFRAMDLTDRQKALLEYAEKLTLDAGSMQDADLTAMREAGLDDEEMLTANLVTAYFNFVNRIVLGLGVEFHESEIKGYKY